MLNTLLQKVSLRRALVFLALVLLLGGVYGQTASQPQEPPKPAPGIGANVPDKPTPPAAAVAGEPQTLITKAQAKALFRSVDEILQFVSQDTGLPIKHKVKRRLITRERVQRYVAKSLADDKDAQRLERSQLVLEKFGLIPHGYDLHGEFLKLLGEQVAAYYDPRTKTVNLLDWVQPELQRPVLAHELTHALQDQTIGLTQWLRAGGKDHVPLPDQQEQVVEEAQAARQNVSEGQAMLAMLDYTLAPSGLNVLKSPEVVDAMRASMTTGTDLPVMATAPMYLRESLYMPYTFGLDFAREVLTKDGTQAAYAGALAHPPADTLEIMRPETYLENRVVPPLTIPDLDKLIAPDYERYDFAGMGAFDVYLLAKQYAPQSDAKQYYSHWRGGYYLAAHAKSAPKDQIGLIYFSRWDTPEAANAFAKMYGDYVPQRYKGAERLPASCPVTKENPECNVRQWDTGQGPVLIELRGTDLLVVEGLDEAVTQRARASLF